MLNLDVCEKCLKQSRPDEHFVNIDKKSETGGGH